MNRITKFKSAAMSVCMAAGLLAAAPAYAADLPSTVVTPPPPIFTPSLAFFVKVGASGVFNTSNVNSITYFPALPALPGGPTFAGNSAHISNAATAYVESGVYITPNVSLSIVGGYPPKFTNSGQNALAALGVLDKETVGLVDFIVAYHLTNFGAFRPFIEGGVGDSIVFHNGAGYLQNPVLYNHVAPVVGGGIDYDLNSNWSIFADVKKAFLTQRLTATTSPIAALGGASVPVYAYVRSDPVIATLGIGYRFGGPAAPVVARY